MAVGLALVVQGVTAPLAGTILCAVLVVALLAHPVLAGDARLDLLVAVALVPLAAILAVAMPIEEGRGPCGPRSSARRSSSASCSPPGGCGSAARRSA